MNATQPDGYLALPEGGQGRPVLVLHAWWGLNETMKGVCDRLAEAGFVAFAPDLYHGQVAATIPEAEALAGALDENHLQARAEIAQAAASLSQGGPQPDEGLAVIGFSLGAFYALDLSAARPDLVHSVVLFYGVGPADFSQAKAAYQGHFAADDAYEPPENVDWLREALREAGRPAEFHQYPGTGHWFFEPDRPDAYDEAAAQLAWERTLAFLRRPM
jgi:carboxymethylenebutenolidase